MTNRGLMYLVHLQRRDGQWIHYRTCDELEARRVAATLGGEVELIDG
jgi:DNA-binding transcriptional ArsR family regulator